MEQIAWDVGGVGVPTGKTPFNPIPLNSGISSYVDLWKQPLYGLRITWAFSQDCSKFTVHGFGSPLPPKTEVVSLHSPEVFLKFCLFLGAEAVAHTSVCVYCRRIHWFHAESGRRFLDFHVGLCHLKPLVPGWRARMRTWRNSLMQTHCCVGFGYFVVLLSSTLSTH